MKFLDWIDQEPSRMFYFYGFVILIVVGLLLPFAVLAIRVMLKI